jgi:hypothetical protein
MTDRLRSTTEVFGDPGTVLQRVSMNTEPPGDRPPGARKVFRP